MIGELIPPPLRSGVQKHGSALVLRENVSLVGSSNSAKILSGVV
jgi:hypothetical protein